MKLNLILFLALIIFSLLKVNTEHLYRKNYSALDSEQKKEIELREEKTKLELEDSDQSGNNRIEEFAKNKLNMIEPVKKNTIILENK
jgi:cell division protein FtsL